MLRWEAGEPFGWKMTEIQEGGRKKKKVLLSQRVYRFPPRKCDRSRERPSRVLPSPSLALPVVSIRQFCAIPSLSPSPSFLLHPFSVTTPKSTTPPPPRFDASITAHDRFFFARARQAAPYRTGRTSIYFSRSNRSCVGPSRPKKTKT